MKPIPTIWRPALVVLLPALLWLLFWYRDTGLAMATIWARSETFTHGFLVPLVTLWLIWRQRTELARLQPRPLWWALPVLLALGLGWLLGELAAINALTQFAMTATIIVSVVFVLGRQVSANLAFPLAFLLLAVPFGDFMMPVLMDWTAKFTVLGLRLSGIPVYQEGLQFVIPSGNWSVVEACSGVRYLIASFTVGTLFAYLNYRSLKRRLLFVLVAILVPILANWMRAYLIVMLGHLSGNKLAAGVDHLIYGWVFFGVVIMLMFMIGARWAEYPDETAGAATPADTSAAPAAARFWLAGLALAVSIVLPHALRAVIERVERAAPPVLQLADAGAGAWKIEKRALTDWQPDFQNPKAELNASFRDGANSVGLYLGYYRGQNYDSKVISSANVLVHSQNKSWARSASGAAQVELTQPNVPVRTAELRPGGALESRSDQRLVVWQVYWINGRLMNSDVLAKAYSAVLRLFGQGDDAAVIVLYAPKDQPGGGQETLQRFAREHGALILTTLQQTKAQR